MYDVAEGLRQGIGQRFFVHPNEVGELCERAYRSHPEWRLRMVASVSEAVEHGLQIYGSPGPVLDGSFPWTSLPAGPGGDSLYPYRPHRFAFLPRMALAVLQRELAAGQLVTILDGWIADAESGRDPFCYGTNLVVIQRILATAWAWVFLAARPISRTLDGLGLEGRLLRILWADVRFLEPRLGSSVPNNHLLADYFAATFINFVLPEFVETADPEVECRFRDEFLRQTYEDGGTFEHSAHYHEFACEMGVAYLLLCERQGREPDSRLRRRVEALLRFQAGLTGAGATPLPFGNGVEDTLFPLDSGEGWCAGSLRELYRSVFGAKITPAPANDVTIERAFWLLGGRLAPAGDCAARDPEITSYPEGGIHAFEDDEWGGRLIFRTGPKEGCLVASGHMHADLLSVYLTRFGMPVIVDAGTYTYRRNSKHWSPDAPSWRSYLAGPAAHNTLTIEGHDPLGAIGGDFRPMEVATRVRSLGDAGPRLSWVEGSVNEAGAYTGYTRGVIHVIGQYWIVYDRLNLVERSDLACWYGFQLASGVRITPGEHRVLAEVPDGPAGIVILTTLPGNPSVLEGSFDPLGGWVSERYGEITPAPQLRYALGPEASLSAFVLSALGAQAPEKVSLIHQEGGDGLSFCISKGGRKDIVVLGAGNAPGSLNGLEGLVFEGRLLWLRLEGGKLVEMRWVRAHSVRWPEYDLNHEFGTQTGELVF